MGRLQIDYLKRNNTYSNYLEISRLTCHHPIYLCGVYLTTIRNLVFTQFQERLWVSVYETTSAGSHYDDEDFRIWKEFNFDSAISTGQAELETGSTAQIAQYFRKQVEPKQIEPSLPQLNQINRYQRLGCGAVLTWADESPALLV